MHATLATEHRTPTSRAAARVRADAELQDFRRYDYCQGWDDDDAALGWVDEEIVHATPRRRGDRTH